MKAISIAICEDDGNDAQKLYGLIELSGISANTRIYESTEVFLEAFEPGLFQLAFLDIYFGDSADGIDAALKIRESDRDIWIAFTTSSPDFAAFGYKVKADRYITKPPDEEEVLSLLNRAAEHFRDAGEEIHVNVDYKPKAIKLKDIRYVESRNKQCILHMQNETIITYAKIDELEKKLTMPCFLRCHRCYIVNMDYIESASRDDRDFIMQGGGSAYIGHSNQWKVRKAYQEYVVRLARGERR